MIMTVTRNTNEESRSVAEEENEDVLDLLLSNRLIRGTDRPTAVDRGDWLRIYRFCSRVKS